MTTSHLTLRLTSQDEQLIERLRAQTGMSKSDLVKLALRTLASNEESSAPSPGGLFALGASTFGRHGSETRQSANMKSVVRARLKAKRRA